MNDVRVCFCRKPGSFTIHCLTRGSRIAVVSPCCAAAVVENARTAATDRMLARAIDCSTCLSPFVDELCEVGMKGELNAAREPVTRSST